MICKCGAETYKGHLEKCESGYPAHIYNSGHWLREADE